MDINILVSTLNTPITVIPPVVSGGYSMTLIVPFVQCNITKYPPVVQLRGVFEATIISEQDDCVVNWRTDTSLWLYSHVQTAPRLGFYTPTINKYGVGLRFQNIDIPPQYTITAAYLIVTSTSNVNPGTVNSVIIGQASNNPPAFSNIDDYKTRRGTVVGGANDNNITFNSVPWNNIQGFLTNVTYQSPDIKTIIQEIVSRGGWAAGNSLVLFWGDHAGNSSMYRTTAAWGHSYSAPLLHIEFSPTSAAVVVPVKEIVINRYPPAFFFIPSVIIAVPTKNISITTFPPVVFLIKYKQFDIAIICENNFFVSSSMNKMYSIFIKIKQIFRESINKWS